MFRVVEPADTFEDVVDTAPGEPPVGAAAAHRNSGQEQRGGLVGGVERSFHLQVAGQGTAGVDGQEHCALGSSLAPNTHHPGPAGRTQQCWSGRLDLIDVKQHKFEASEPNSSSKGCRFGLVALKTGPKPPDE